MTFVKITEQPSSHGDLDKMSVRELLEGINDEDARVAPAVRRTIPQLEKLVTAVVERMRRGGRIFYLGAGTSGRLGVLERQHGPEPCAQRHGHWSRAGTRCTAHFL